MSLWEKLRGKLASPRSVGVSQAAVDRASAPREGATVLRAPATTVAAKAGTSFAPDADHKIAGTFLVKKVLGSGSMGTVYLVQHPSWNTEVALKVPTATLVADAENRHRITVETEAWTELGLHPHIAYCYYVQTLNGVLLMVVEYVDGGNLAQWIAKHGQSAEVKTKLDLAIQFCHALEHAHGKGLVHRDIKPSNVLLTKDGQLKLTDFGIARVGAGPGAARAPVPGAPVDGTMVGIGTEDYMPPEQWVSAQVDARADLFAFGVCMYELFCGRRPYVGRLIGESKEPLDPAKLAPNLPAQLCELLRHCVCWQADMRPGTAAGIREELRAIREKQTNEPSPFAEIPPYTVDAAVLNNRALSYIELGKPELAEEAWKAALQADARHIEAIYNYGLHEWRHARLAPDALIKRLATAADPEHVGLSAYLRAQVHLEAGEAEEAMQRVDAIASGPVTAAEAEHTRRAAQAVRASSVPKRRFDGHGDAVISLCVSSDHRQALSSSYGSLKLWDLESGECLQTLADGGGTKIGMGVGVAIGVDSTARSVMLGPGWMKTMSWDLASGLCKVGRTLDTRHPRSISVTADGRYGLVQCLHGMLELWDLTNGELARELIGPMDKVSGATACFIDSKGHRALSGHGNGSIKLWDLHTGRLLLESPGHTNYVKCLCMSSNGRLALSGDGDWAIKLWDLETGQCLRTLVGHTRPVTAVSMSADGREASSGSEDCTVKVWDLTTGRCRHSFLGHTGQVTAVCLLQEERATLSASGDQTLVLWHWPSLSIVAPWRLSGAAASRELMLAGVAYQNQVLQAGRLLAQGDLRHAREILSSARSGAFQRSPAAFDLWTNLYRRLRKRRLRDHWCRDLCSNPTEAVSLSVDGHYAISGGTDDRALKLWDVSSGALVRQFVGHTDIVCAVSISTDCRFVLSGAYPNDVKHWDLKTGECLRTISEERDVPTPASLSADGRIAVSAHYEAVRVWHLESGKCLRTLEGHTGQVRGVVLSADVAQVLSCGSDNTLRIWDLASGKCLHRCTGHSGYVRSICQSADGRYVLSGSNDATVKLWELASGRCIRTLVGHTAQVASVCISTDGRFGLSGGSDSTIKLWDLVSGDCLETFNHHANEVNCICFAADGRHFVSAAKDGVKVTMLDWELEDSEPADWDEGARPHLEVFLQVQQPYVASLPQGRAPTDEEVTRALTRAGPPVWTEEDFQRLLDTLGCTGFGWLRPEGVRKELERMAKAMASGKTG